MYYISSTMSQALVILLVAACVYHILPQKVIQDNEEKSSPSRINATKGSCVWLHWNYTYIGDGRHGFVTTNYKEQRIGFNCSSDSSIKTLAIKIGQNGALTLESPVPAPFKGRVNVIPSNSTLVICGLHYNDSGLQFLSIIEVDVNVGAGHKQNTFNTKPVVSVSVYGVPVFKKLPPDTLDVNESSDLHLTIEMDGNPLPSADFKWSHLPPSSTANVPGVQLYPYVYSSTFTLYNVDENYCGRLLQTAIKNSIGSSVIMLTNITVLLTLDKPINMTVKKLPKSGCLELRWNKVHSGTCYVRYDVVWKTAPGGGMLNRSGYNIDRMEICHVNPGAEIIGAQLIITFENTVKHFDMKISEKPFTTPPPTKADALLYIIAGSIAGVLGVVVTIISYKLRSRRYKRRRELLSGNRDGEPPRGTGLQRGPSIVENLASSGPSSPTVLDVENLRGDAFGFEQIMLEDRLSNLVHIVEENNYAVENVMQTSSTTEKMHKVEEIQTYENIKLRSQTREGESRNASQTGYAAFGAMPESNFGENERMAQRNDAMQCHDGWNRHLAETQF